MQQTVGKSTVAAVVLAAGRSSRMAGGRNKLLARIDDVPQVRRAVVTALAAEVPVMVVLGHQAELLQAQIADLPVTVVFNPDFASGMASSLRLAVGHVPAGTDGLLVHLADMPMITAEHLGALVSAFGETGGEAVVRASADRVPGNPVILPRVLFPALAGLTGDSGARALIKASGLPVVTVELGAAAAFDIDTLEAMTEVGGVWGDTVAPDAVP